MFWSAAGWSFAFSWAARASAEVAADGGEAAGGFGGAGEPFVAVAGEGEALGGGALGLADEGVEGGGGVAFGIARGADLVGELGQDGAVAVGGRGGERGFGGGKRLRGVVAFGREALAGFLEGGAAQGEAFDILLGAEGGFVRLRAAARASSGTLRRAAISVTSASVRCAEAAARASAAAAARGGGRSRVSASSAARRARCSSFSADGSGASARADEAVPAPEVAFAADEALAGREAWQEVEALRAIDEPALRQARAEFGGGFDEIGERLCACGEGRGDVARAAGPVGGGVCGRWARRDRRQSAAARARSRPGARTPSMTGGASVSAFAQQAVEAFQFGFEFADPALGGEQRRREAGFERAGFVDGCVMAASADCAACDLPSASAWRARASFSAASSVAASPSGGEFGLCAREVGVARRSWRSSSRLRAACAAAASASARARAVRRWSASASKV